MTEGGDASFKSYKSKSKVIYNYVVVILYFQFIFPQFLAKITYADLKQRESKN